MLMARAKAAACDAEWQDTTSEAVIEKTVRPDIVLQRRHGAAVLRTLAPISGAFCRPGKLPPACRDGARLAAIDRGGWLGGDANETADLTSKVLPSYTKKFVT